MVIETGSLCVKYPQGPNLKKCQWFASPYVNAQGAHCIATATFTVEREEQEGGKGSHEMGAMQKRGDMRLKEGRALRRKAEGGRCTATLHSIIKEGREEGRLESGL